MSGHTVPTGPDWTALAFDAVAELVVVIDSGGRVVHANRRAEVELGAQLGEWVGRSALEVLHPGDVAVGAELLVSAQTGEPGTREPVRYRLRGGNGRDVPVVAIATKVDVDGCSFLVMSARPDRTPRGSEAVVGEVSTRLAQMFEEAAIGLAQVDVGGRFLRVNRQLCADLGTRSETLRSSRIHEIVVPEGRAAFDQVWEQLVSGHAASFSTGAALAVDGVRVEAHLTGAVIADRWGSPMYVAVQVLNVTERVRAEAALRRSQRELREAQERLVHQSTHDALTGAGNRLLLDEAFQRLHDQDPLQPVAVLCIDLDGFKPVNDRHGHGTGDQLLVEVAARLAEASDPRASVVRMGGDEFLVLTPTDSLADALVMADTVLEQLRAPYRLATATVTVEASAGLLVTTPRLPWPPQPSSSPSKGCTDAGCQGGPE